MHGGKTNDQNDNSQITWIQEWHMAKQVEIVMILS